MTDKSQVAKDDRVDFRLLGRALDEWIITTLDEWIITTLDEWIITNEEWRTEVAKLRRRRSAVVASTAPATL